MKTNRPRKKPARAAVNAATRDLIRVVLADDHTVVRAGIRKFLESARDMTVVAEAGDGQQAIEAVRRTAPDVAVLDLRMPKASGIDVTKWIRENAPRTTVLVLSAYDEEPYVLAALQAGANGYVLKSADAEDIVRSVRSVHTGKSAVDPEIAAKMLRSVSGDSRAEGQPEKLTERERDVLVLAARGHTNKAIGSALHISARTVQGHLAHVFDKLHAESRTEAVMRAASLGWLPASLDRLTET